MKPLPVHSQKPAMSSCSCLRPETDSEDEYRESAEKEKKEEIPDTVDGELIFSTAVMGGVHNAQSNQRDREKERQKIRERERRREQEKQREKDRNTEREKERRRQRERQRQAEKQRQRQADKQRQKLAEKQRQKKRK